MNWHYWRWHNKTNINCLFLSMVRYIAFGSHHNCHRSNVSNFRSRAIWCGPQGNISHRCNIQQSTVVSRRSCSRSCLSVLPSVCLSVYVNKLTRYIYRRTFNEIFHVVVVGTRKARKTFRSDQYSIRMRDIIQFIRSVYWGWLALSSASELPPHTPNGTAEGTPVTPAFDKYNIQQKKKRNIWHIWSKLVVWNILTFDRYDFVGVIQTDEDEVYAYFLKHAIQLPISNAQCNNATTSVRQTTKNSKWYFRPKQRM